MRRVGRKQPGVSLGLSLLFLLSAFSTTAFAQQTQPAGVPTCTSTSVTLSNQNPYPIWIGENVSTGSILFPGNTANWELDSGDSKSVCIPADWTSGIFWARTECNFAGTFGQDSNYVDCTSTSQCSQTPNPHICYGGKCVIDCSTSTGTNGNCSALSQLGLRRRCRLQWRNIYCRFLLWLCWRCMQNGRLRQRLVSVSGHVGQQFGRPGSGDASHAIRNHRQLRG